MRCTKHGLAAGPDGACVLCRREATADTAGSSKHLVWVGVSGVALVTALLVLARPFGALLTPAVSVAPAAPSIVAEALTPAPEPEPVADRPSLPDPVAPSFEVPVEPEFVAPALAPAVSASAAATPTPSASQARPSDAALASAIRDTPIIMFTTAWCGVCGRAREFLSANGLRYRERDIDHDESARTELKRRTGKSSIPTIEVDGELLTPGFSPRAITAAVASSVQRRLGVTGVEVRPRR